MELDQLDNEVREAAKDVYKTLGAGYNETVYEEAMAVEFRNRKIPYAVEKNTEIFYKGEKVGIHRLDFILNDKLIVELKAQYSITGSHVSQAKAYLQTLKLYRGIVVNFPYPEKKEPEFQSVNIQ